MSGQAMRVTGGLLPGTVLRRGSAIQPVVGVLADGTPYYAPRGEVVTEGPRVTCHLCGRSFKSVAAHLRSHGWTKVQYCETFGLERGQSLEGTETRKLRSAAFSARLIFEPAVRAGSAAGRERARAGQLTRDAAKAARGRAFPEQRRRKASQARAGASPPANPAESRARADRHLAAKAAGIARRQGYPDIRSLIVDRTRAGSSLAAISQRAGLHKDWLSRHLARVDPVAADLARQGIRDRPDTRWFPVLASLGYADVASYLRDRHLAQHQTVHAIATEIGISHVAVESALSRHGLMRTPHAAKRHAAEQRAVQVAKSLGHDRITAYISRRRADGWTWMAISAESGQPPTWLRRHATLPDSTNCPHEQIRH
jgi:predicted transcriptional regulator